MPKQPDQTAEEWLKEARSILDVFHAMGPGLTVNDKVVFIAACLAKAHCEGRQKTEDALLEEIEEAFWGAYDSAPSGEGVMGSAIFGCRAAALAATGMKAPEAVAKAIGEVGHYGMPRKYKLVLREPGDPL